MSVTKQLMDFHIIVFPIWKSMGFINSLVIDIFQNIFLCVQQKKEIHTGLQQLEGE